MEADQLSDGLMRCNGHWPCGQLDWLEPVAGEVLLLLDTWQCLWGQSCCPGSA